jgi:hypothetical protein
VSLFGKPVITGHELAAGTPSIKLGCHSHISDGGAFVAQTGQFVVYLEVDIVVKAWSTRARWVVKGG